MHNNPVALAREIINKAVGEGAPGNKGPTTEEIIKEQERLRALHEGWVQHPITIEIIKHLERKFFDAEQKAFADWRTGVSSPKIGEAAALFDILDYIKNYNIR